MASSSLIKVVLLAAILGCAYSVGIYEQCAGEGYGTFPCNPGLACFRRNKWFSSCQTSCPKNLGWECETYFPPTPVPTIAAGWDQCGGGGWVGPRVCAAGFVCHARSVQYSQCRPPNDCPAGWACVPIIVTTPAPVVGPIILPAYAKCNNVGNAICPSGTACFRNNNLYSECRPSCPSSWACETDVVGPFEQCGGDAWVGLKNCATGYVCYARNVQYSQCRPVNDCPADWACAPLIVTTPPPVVGPVILPAYAKCNNISNSICPNGTACFRNNDIYSECRPSCPSTWVCETDVVGPNEQCGGEGYVGLKRCAEGLRCYVRSQWYSHCAATCPGVNWVC